VKEAGAIPTSTYFWAASVSAFTPAVVFTAVCENDALLRPIEWHTEDRARSLGVARIAS
jgi:hypothetical protein